MSRTKEHFAMAATPRLLRSKKIQLFRLTGKVVRCHSYADRPDEELLGAYDRMIEAAESKEDPFEGFHYGKKEWEADEAEDDGKDLSCGSYSLEIIDGRDAPLSERGYAQLTVDSEDLAALKRLAKIDCRTQRQFFKKMVAAELDRVMPRSTEAPVADGYREEFLKEKEAK